MLAVYFFYASFLMSMAQNVYSAGINMTQLRSRKIKGGKFVSQTVRYMVYLTKAEQSRTHYDAWICGGAIVSKDFIVTSAACVEDVQHMYAISGYHRYVNARDIDKDECTRASKKKIVFICVPKSYHFAYEKIEKWAYIDIAAVKVESPYDFSAPVLRGCAWAPDKIDINYETIYQSFNRDAMILGWGHAEKWRAPGDPEDYNQDLQYGSIKIIKKKLCKQMYSNTPKLLPIIDKYMICAMNEGNLDESGNPIKGHKGPKVDGCARKALKTGSKCQESAEINEENDYGRTDYVNPHQMPETTTPSTYVNQEEETKTPTSYVNQDESREHYENKPDEPPIADDEIIFEDIFRDLRRSRGNKSQILNNTRKAGICQNDHGGPIVTWVGMRERLIGVASVFRLDNTFSCVGPYLFTSTKCNGGFLNCVINADENFDAVPDNDDYSDRDHIIHVDYSNSSDDVQENNDNQDTSPDNAKENDDYSDTTSQDSQKKKNNPDKSTKEAEPKNKNNAGKSTDDEQKNKNNADKSKNDDEKNKNNADKSKNDEQKNKNNADKSKNDEQKNKNNAGKSKEAEKKKKNNPNKSKEAEQKNKNNADKTYPTPEDQQKYKNQKFRMEGDKILVDEKPLLCNKTIGKFRLECYNGVATFYEWNEVLHKRGITRGILISGLRRSAFCDLPPQQKGFDVIERRISWKNHPDGPAENEESYDTFKRSSSPNGNY